MIVGKKSGCCGGSALRDFGAGFLNTEADLYKAVLGAQNSDEMILVWSEWCCGDVTRRYVQPVGVQEALVHAGDGARVTMLLQAYQLLLEYGYFVHPSASCAQGAGDGGFSINTILDWGKKAVDLVKPLVDDVTGNKDDTTTPPGTNPGTKPPAGSSASPFSNPTLLIGLGAASVAAFLLLGPKKRK